MVCFVSTVFLTRKPGASPEAKFSCAVMWVLRCCDYEYSTLDGEAFQYVLVAQHDHVKTWQVALACTLCTAQVQASLL
jgi:hypothetical protein